MQWHHISCGPAELFECSDAIQPPHRVATLPPCALQYLRLYSRVVDESARIGNEAGHGGTNVCERKEIRPNNDRRAEH